MNPYHSLASVQSDLFNNKITCVELVESYLKRIESAKNLNIFLETFGDAARAKAKLVDEKVKSKTAGKLAGMVIAIKDNLCYKGQKLSASSKILEGFESLYDATVVERLLAEDAVIIGRCNCDEFAMGSSNENSAFGNVLNPLNIKYVSGGSSGGSAAAVASDLCLAALGTDTGGSIRQPASFCGVVGLKPSYGRVSRYGAIAYASSFDQIGPITKNVDDAAILLEVMAGRDNYDSTSSSKPVPSYSKEIAQTPKKLRIAYLDDCVNSKGLDPEIKTRLFDIIEKLKGLGHEVEPVRFSFLDYIIPTYYILTTAEASSNLSRFAGITYGYQSKNATDIESTYKKSRSEGFGKEVKRRIMLGTFVLSAGYYDAYYSKAQKVRRLIKNQTDSIFESHDFILLPTTPGTAFEFGKKSTDPIEMYLEDIFTVQANITGLPAISLPLGKHSNQLPFGIQLIGKSFSENSLLAFSKQLTAI
ncbi:MAG TPA: Asp-tRNA(Asn)/Glu-tRNA(Gln) amidotransferase subunit GatA [Bacteroidia bacterium]|nr:Asp-tRNA(Asn)/Glu-tRNA(Gln) amidotransferase subunit GatA [Bacteroidia bacterium]